MIEFGPDGRSLDPDHPGIIDPTHPDYAENKSYTRILRDWLSTQALVKAEEEAAQKGT